MSDRDEWIRTLAEGGAEAIDAVRSALRRGSAPDEVEWLLAQLLEEAGRHREAFRAYQRALRDRPDDPDLLLRLSELYEERGDLDRAASLAERAFRLDRRDPRRFERFFDLLLVRDAFERAREAVEEARAAGLDEEVADAALARLPAAERSRAAGLREAEEERTLRFTDADLVAMLGLFQGRENVYARQWTRRGGETGYAPVHEPLTPDVLRNHLLGNVTVGVYPLRLDGTVAFCAFDLDLTKKALQRARGDGAYARELRAVVEQEARRLAAALRDLGVPFLAEDSGYKGRHLWVFFARPEPAALVRRFGEWFLRLHAPRRPEVRVEFFPRQIRPGAKGLGNLIKLPLGVHRRTGRRCVLLDEDGDPVADPFDRLRAQERVDHEAFVGLLERLKKEVGRLPPAPAAGKEAARRSGPAGEADEEAEEEHAPSLEAEAGAAEVRPPWTEADFETNPEIATLLARCPVLARIKQKAESERRLDYDERVVLKHAMGHSAAGADAVNYLLDLCVDVAPEERMQSPFRGHPISCPKIRKRVPHITARVPCNCVFPSSPDHYPTPRLHLVEAEVEDAARRPGDGEARRAASGRDRAEREGFDPVDRARALALLRDRIARLEEERADLERRLHEWMRDRAVFEIDLGDGYRLALRSEGGGPEALVFEKRDGGSGGAEKNRAGPQDGGS